MNTPVNQKYELSNYVAAFIDILGQSEKLGKYPILPPLNERDKYFNEWIENTFGLVNNFYKLFEIHFASMNNYNSSYLDKNKYDINNIKISPQSDSLTLYSSLKNDTRTIPTIDIFSIINACAGMFLLLLSNKVVIRVGIEIGIGMELDKVGLYGSVISKAYAIESKRAINPRILIGGDLYKYLLTISQLKNEDFYMGDKERYKFSKYFAELILNKLTIKDYDNELILNYLNPFFIEQYKKSGMIHIIDQAKAFIEESLCIPYADSIKNKYLYLKDFINKNYQ